MNVLIIEDERHAANRLVGQLNSVDPEIRVLQVLESVQQSVEWFLRNRPPDLIFMDIQLDDGICFEIFEAVKINTPVIFTTAFNEYALRAFKVNSIDYLLKPIDPEQLKTAILKFRDLFPVTKNVNEKIEKLVSQLISNFKARFFVKVGEHCRSVPVEEIRMFCILERGVFLKTSDHGLYDLDYSLDQLQQMLDPAKFFRINRTHIINISFVQDIITYSSSRLKVILKNEKEPDDMIVSRDKVPAFRKWLDQ